MQFTTFGATGLTVSRACLGTMTFGLQAQESVSFAIMDAAAEAGVNFLDCADVYPWVLANPLVTAPVIGASRPDQLQATLAATDIALAPDLNRRLDDLTADYRRGDALR